VSIEASSRALLVVGCASLLAAGCGSSAPRNELPSRRLAGEAALEDDERSRFVVGSLTLPEPPASVDVDEPALEPVLRHARELLARPLPTPEATTSASELGAFVDGRLAGWMNATAQGIRSLWQAMQQLETRVLGAHVVARAITGATLVALAERIDAMPLPDSIRADAALSSGIRDALDNASRPMRERAIQAFGACASESIGSADPTLDEWRLHCDAESTRASAPRHE
jgi:hypothetical protein